MNYTYILTIKNQSNEFYSFYESRDFWYTISNQERLFIEAKQNGYIPLDDINDPDKFYIFKEENPEEVFSDEDFSSLVGYNYFKTKQSEFKARFMFNQVQRQRFLIRIFVRLQALLEIDLKDILDLNEREAHKMEIDVLRTIYKSYDMGLDEIIKKD